MSLEKPFKNKEREQEKPFDEEGLLNRNFGKNIEKPSEALFYKDGILNRPKFQKMTHEQQGQEKRGDVEKIQQIQEELEVVENKPIESEQTKSDGTVVEKPLMQQMVEAYQKLSDDPEKSAREALYNRFNSNLSEEEKQEQMMRMNEEYRLYREGKNWK